MTSHFRIFSGRANLPLAQKISHNVKHRLNKIEITDFPDSEIHIKLKESVRGRDVFIIQSLSRFVNHSVNDALMELCLMLDAARRASAKKNCGYNSLSWLCSSRKDDYRKRTN